MAVFSKRSLGRLAECHPDLQKVMHAAIERFDFSVVCGHRNKKDQNAAYRRGFSKLKFPQSKHNHIPSLAVDIIPYPTGYKDIQAFHEMKTVVFEEAERLGVKLRWGGDWDGDGDTKDERFIDMPHFEIA